MNKLNVLLGDVSSYKAIIVAKFLTENYCEITIYTYDSSKITNKLHTKYSRKHFITGKNKMHDFQSIINEYNIDIFIPVLNSEIEVILHNRNKFNGSLDYLGDYNLFSKLNNKKQLMEIASQLNIKIPKTYNNIYDARCPFVIKPSESSSAKGVHYIWSEEELNFAKEEYHGKTNYIIQEYIKGIGVGYSVYAKDGNIIEGYGHKRLAEYPTTGGSSVYRETYEDERMRAIANVILKEVPWTGFAMFEFKLTDKNELYLIEVNPRIWGSINQGLQNGVNYFKPILGKSKITNEETKQVRTYLSPLIYLSLVNYMTKLKFKPLCDFIKNFNCNRADISFWDDPKGFLSIIARRLF